MKLFRSARLLRRALKTSRIPGSAKWLMLAALVYGVLPIDLVPDLIPILGQIDDVIVIVSLVMAAVRRIVAKQAAREAVPAARLGIDGRKIIR